MWKEGEEKGKKRDEGKGKDKGEETKKRRGRWKNELRDAWNKAKQNRLGYESMMQSSHVKVSMATRDHKSTATSLKYHQRKSYICIILHACTYNLVH
jgi:hypothetical protein